jgi:threonine aldolase
MRQAMANAAIGDDVYGEDPTINELETLAAAKVGMEAGMFVASGTMGNLTAILTHAARGDEAIVGVDSHTYRAEAGGMATLGGIVPRPLPTDTYGRMDLDIVETAVHPDDPHNPHTSLLLVENSYGTKYGYPIQPDYFADMRAIANRHNLNLHLDGARLFNAAVALNVDAQAITQHVDSVSLCLSKGLCAPVGSVVCGTAEFIHRARRARKVVGGGMRQAGFMAAAGIVALHEMIERLADDHHHAKMLADGLAQIPGIEIEPEMIKTNIVFFGLRDDVPFTRADFVNALHQMANIWLGTSGRDRFRAVTHYWIGEAEVKLFLQTVAELLSKT